MDIGSCLAQFKNCLTLSFLLCCNKIWKLTSLDLEEPFFHFKNNMSTGRGANNIISATVSFEQYGHSVKYILYVHRHLCSQIQIHTFWWQINFRIKSEANQKLWDLNPGWSKHRLQSDHFIHYATWNFVNWA